MKAVSGQRSAISRRTLFAAFIAFLRPKAESRMLIADRSILIRDLSGECRIMSGVITVAEIRAGAIKLK